MQLNYFLPVILRLIPTLSTSSDSMSRRLINDIFQVIKLIGQTTIDEMGRQVFHRDEITCAEGIGDLLRLVRADHPTTRDVFVQICSNRTMETHLIPLLRELGSDGDRRLRLNTLKLIVLLTMPVSPDFVFTTNKQAADRIQAAVFLPHYEQLQRAFIDESLLALLLVIAMEPLEEARAAQARGAPADECLTSVIDHTAPKR